MGNIECWWRVIRPLDQHVTWTDEDPSDRLEAAWADAMVEGPYVPEADYRGAVEALRRIAAGHAHPSKLAGEALDALPPDDNVYDPPYIERGQ